MSWVDRRKLSDTDEKLVAEVASLLAEPEPVVDIPVFEMLTTYTISVLPEGHIDRPIFEITVEYRDRGKWAVCRMRQCLSVDGQWHFEPNPSGRDDDWLASHRFDLDAALSMAREAAPNVRCNRVTAREVAAQIGATP